MKYMLLAYGNEEKFAALTPADMAGLVDKCTRYDEEFRATGKVIGGGSLSFASKSLRLKSGKLVVNDGPYLETKELVGGVVIIEADTFDEAVQLASLHPAARMGEELGWAIELRPMEQCILRSEALQSGE
ncbi:MAG: hypothetical protein K0Q72_455 [Armatimonadetes bacterium]|jgi:hypothetical protein|nr:hypothetical protein [Armatimonadota bacterium]